MKFTITILLILLANTSIAQIKIPTNRPDLITPIVNQWQSDARSHGFEFESRFKELKSIHVVSKLPGIAMALYYPKEQKIEISMAGLNRDEDGSIRLVDLKWKIYHEIGHHFGLDNCLECRYFIMSGNFTDRAVYLYRDEILKRWIDEQYFTILKDPATFNENHIHR